MRRTPSLGWAIDVIDADTKHLCHFAPSYNITTLTRTKEMSDSCCGEPLHVHGTDPKAHKKHHWAERFKCLAFCTAAHVVYELVMHFGFNHH